LNCVSAQDWILGHVQKISRFFILAIGATSRVLMECHGSHVVDLHDGPSLSKFCTHATVRGNGSHVPRILNSKPKGSSLRATSANWKDGKAREGLGLCNSF
jgi:hypothetical protein